MTAVASEDINPKDVLSTRQLMILCLISQDICRKEIASQLSISLKAVSDGSAIIRHKLKVDGIAGMTKVALRYKLIDL